MIRACNALLMPKDAAIKCMPELTALTCRRDMGSLIYVKPGIFDLLIAFEIVRTEFNTVYLPEKPFLNACKQIRAADRDCRERFFRTVWEQQQSLQSMSDLDLAVAQRLFDKLWAKYAIAGRKDLFATYSMYATSMQLCLRKSGMLTRSAKKM